MCILRQVSYVCVIVLGKICVPIDPTRPHDFYVSKVPTLTECINELGQSKFSKVDEIAVP